MSLDSLNRATGFLPHAMSYVMYNIVYYIVCLTYDCLHNIAHTTWYVRGYMRYYTYYIVHISTSYVIPIHKYDIIGYAYKKAGMDLDRVREAVCAQNCGYTAINHQSGCDREAMLYMF